MQEASWPVFVVAFLRLSRLFNDEDVNDKLQAAGGSKAN